MFHNYLKLRDTIYKPRPVAEPVHNIYTCPIKECWQCKRLGKK